MKKFIFGLLILSTISAQAAVKCDESSVQKTIQKGIESTVGESAGGNDLILGVSKIKVLATEDVTGEIVALYSYSQIIGEDLSSANNFQFEMLGYARFEKDTCTQIDGISIGSGAVVETNTNCESAAYEEIMSSKTVNAKLQALLADAQNNLEKIADISVKAQELATKTCQE
jgi:hypothetical protein